MALLRDVKKRYRARHLPGRQELFDAVPGAAREVVTFCYSLPRQDWDAEIERAIRGLKPGGWLGIVDDASFDTGVVSFLRQRLECCLFVEKKHRLPYLPFIRVPYFVFLGRVPFS